MTLRRLLAAIAAFIALSMDVSHAQSAAGAVTPSPTFSAGDDSSREYIIAVQDVLRVATWGQADLTGTFTVQFDGTLTLPLLGRVPAAGLTLAQLEAQLTTRLGDGFIKMPRVAVSLDQPRGRRIFVFGNVGAPGTYPLPDGGSLIEALVKAGYASAAEAVIIRPRQPAAGPVLPEQAGDAEVMRISLRDLEKDAERGSLVRNVVLKDGDTIFVPRTDPRSVFVTGQVRVPGAYSIAEGTTVLQALTLAGGTTEQAALNRLRITRLVNGKQTSVKASIRDIVKAGDTLVVPERFF